MNSESDSRLVDVPLSDASTPDLRLFLRDHVFWMFVACGIVTAGLLLPSAPWLWLLPKYAVTGVGLFLGATRLLHINGIVEELQERRKRKVEGETSPPAS